MPGHRSVGFTHAVTDRTPVPDRVLIIDDDARVRAALRALIETSTDYVVGEAAGPAEARARATEWHPHVVLCDLLLPDPADGLRLLRTLAADSAVCVIAMSMRSELREPAFAAGARAFLEKGATPDALLAALRDTRELRQGDHRHPLGPAVPVGPRRRPRRRRATPPATEEGPTDMQIVHITALAPRVDADEVFDRIRDFARYPEHSADVRHVTVIAQADGTRTSHWSVNLRGDVRCWSQIDRIDRARRLLAFERVDGDFAFLEGEWTVNPAGADTQVGFTAVFDLGIPSLAEIVGPAAERTLRRILRGLLGDDVRFAEHAAHALARA